MKMRIFLDLDNTLADFSYTNGEEYAVKAMWRKGYFRNLALFPYAQELVNHLYKEEKAGKWEIYFLTTCITSKNCVKDKIEWLNEHFPNIPKEKRLFLVTGQSKSDFVNSHELSILVDDYGKNLRDWEKMGGIPIRIDHEREKEDFNSCHSLMEVYDKILEIYNSKGKK